jgi:hypothetical protein
MTKSSFSAPLFGFSQQTVTTIWIVACQPKCSTGSSNTSSANFLLAQQQMAQWRCRYHSLCDWAATQLRAIHISIGAPMIVIDYFSRNS